LLSTVCHSGYNKTQFWMESCLVCREPSESEWSVFLGELCL